jgi:hypothetical protein
LIIVSINTIPSHPALSLFITQEIDNTNCRELLQGQNSSNPLWQNVTHRVRAAIGTVGRPLVGSLNGVLCRVVEGWFIGPPSDVQRSLVGSLNGVLCRAVEGWFIGPLSDVQRSLVGSLNGVLCRAVEGWFIGPLSDVQRSLVGSLNGVLCRAVEGWFIGPLSDVQISQSRSLLLLQVSAIIVFRGTEKKATNKKSEY